MTKEDSSSPIGTVLDKLPSSQLGKPSFGRLGAALGALTEAGLYKIGISKVHEYNVRKNLELTKNLERLGKEFDGEEPIITIPVELVQPVVERLSYVADPKIADLFVKLLSAAGHESTSGLAHPSFIHLIDQLTPDEAILLNALKNIQSLEYIEYGLKNPKPEASGATYIRSHYFSRLYEISELTYPENCELYMENLISLGLFEIREGWFVGVADANGRNVPNVEYKRLEDLARAKVDVIPEPLKFYSKQGILSPTSKGKTFIKVATA